MHKATDTSLMQTNDARGLHNELLTGIERFQNYGHTSVPLPPDQDGEKAAESLIIFLHGNRAHPVVIAVDDRRHRPKNLQPGENALYDDQGQQVYISRSGIQIVGGSKKLPVTVTVGSSTLTVADGKIITAKVGSGATATAAVIKSDAVYLGEDPDQGGSFDFVQTVSAPSVNVKAKIG